MKKHKEKVLMCLSGGVDSSVAAALLVRDGYDVTGMFAVNFQDSTSASCDDSFTGRSGLRGVDDRSPAKPCWRDDYQDALRVAAKLGIPLLRWDFTREYRREVLDYMYSEYQAGRTPNPDVLCNKFIKFGAWLERAKKSGFDFIATGHYARNVERVTHNVRNSKKMLHVPRYALCVAADDNKDQTYFLHQLSQQQLARTMFPLGDYTKPEVRRLAHKFNLPTADKEESMGICFVGEVPMKEFLQKEIKPRMGDIILSDGVKVGEHDGLAFYTIGERIRVSPSAREGAQGGVGVSASATLSNLPLRKRETNTKPMFVVDKNIKENKLVVGFEDDPLLYKSEITVSEINWTSGHAPEFPLKCKVRLRHRQPLQACHCEKAAGRRSNPNAPHKLTVTFTTPQRAVTPGQFAVFYKDNECLGGGVIQ